MWLRPLILGRCDLNLRNSNISRVIELFTNIFATIFIFWGTKVTQATDAIGTVGRGRQHIWVITRNNVKRRSGNWSTRCAALFVSADAIGLLLWVLCWRLLRLNVKGSRQLNRFDSVFLVNFVQVKHWEFDKAVFYLDSNKRHHAFGEVFPVFLIWKLLIFRGFDNLEIIWRVLNIIEATDEILSFHVLFLDAIDLRWVNLAALRLDDRAVGECVLEKAFRAFAIVLFDLESFLRGNAIVDILVNIN